MSKGTQKQDNFFAGAMKGAGIFIVVVIASIVSSFSGTLFPRYSTTPLTSLPTMAPGLRMIRTPWNLVSPTSFGQLSLSRW